jgi:hypothetical protein
MSNAPKPALKHWIEAVDRLEYFNLAFLRAFPRDVRRREFIAALGGGTASWPLTVRALG